MNIDECRRFYANEIRFAAGVRSPELVDAFARVSREEFLGPGPWELASPDIRAMSIGKITQMRYQYIDDPRDVYHNVVIVLDKDAEINNGQPSALALWIDALDLRTGERAYHLGCGVGYYTAIIAELVGAAGNVVGSELQPDLAARAQQNLRRYPNVTVHSGDGAVFDPGPCDAILVNAGVTHPLPLWLDRLRDGGRLVLPLTMPVNPKIGLGVMARIVRKGSAFSAEIVSQVGIYSCTTARDQQCESLLKSALTTGGLMKMKSVRRDQHPPVDTCLVHGTDVCVSSDPTQT